MTKLYIRGGRPLRGETGVRGSKNAASKMMIASLLTSDQCVIDNIPLSLETEITKELCESIGSKVSFGEDRSCIIETKYIRNSHVSELSRKNRIPILALGPLLHRKGFAEVPVLGGCPIGHRPINLHVEALNKMGVRIERRESSYYAEALEIHGADIALPFPSVGATESVILTAALAKGSTVIRNAALEPEILNLVRMLQSMGAEISFDESAREIKVRGVKKLRGTQVSVMPDRNEVVSFAIAAFATAGDILINGADAKHLAAFLKKVEEVGGSYEIKSSGIRFFGKKPYRSIGVDTAPHPGFMTDWQQPFCVLLTQAIGESIIHETIYEDRFGYTKDLNRMGARIMVSDECLGTDSCRFQGRTFNHSVRIQGPTKLQGVEVIMQDIRAGMAHIIAALAAEGESVISGVEHVDRGYEKIDERLRGLGADIKRLV